MRAPQLPASIPEKDFARGRITELASGPDTAATSLAVQGLLLGQREGDRVAWLQRRDGGLYPPDLILAGVDLAALLVVHAPAAAGPAALPKAAEVLLRTGAFGVIVLDLRAPGIEARPRFRSHPPGQAWVGRLGALAREEDARVLLLGPRGTAQSCGSMVHQRVEARRRAIGRGRYRLEFRYLKGGAGSSNSPVHTPGPLRWRGPEGMP